MAKVQYLSVMYDFIDDGKGDLMMVMEAPEGPADDDNAKIVYDCTERQAMLFRNSGQVIRMPLLTEKARSMLTDGREKLLVTEMNGEDIADVYEARLEFLNAGEDNSPVLTEYFYEIITNAENDILFAIKTRDGEPVEPEILYSGGENALLRRRPDQFILLDEVHEDVRKTVFKAEEALIAEVNIPDEEDIPLNPETGAPVILTKESSILREYSVKIRRVPETLESVESIVSDGYLLFTGLRSLVYANADKPIAEVIGKEDHINLAAVLAREEDYGLLDRYFAEGLPVNGQVSDQFKTWRPTPLFYVTTNTVFPVLKEPVKMLNYLVKHGADVNMASGEGDTPLCNQCYSNGNIETLKALLEAGADPNKKDYFDGTYMSPLLMVLCPEEYDEETHTFTPLTQDNVERAKLLVKAGANVNVTNDSGETPLGMAITHSRAEQQAELADLFLKNGADVGAALKGMEECAEGGHPEYYYALYDFYSGLLSAKSRMSEDITKWEDGEAARRCLKLSAEAGYELAKKLLSNFNEW